MPISISHVKSLTIADFTGTVTVGNSSGGTATMMATDLARPSDWNSQHASTLSLTGSEIASLFNFGFGLSSTTGAGGLTVGIKTLGFYEPFLAENTNSTLSAPGIGTWYNDPVPDMPGIGSGQINILMADAAGFLNGAVYSAATTGSVTKVMTLNNQLAFYTRGAGASTSRLESVWTADCSFLATQQVKVSSASSNSFTVSNLMTVSFPAQWNASGAVTYSSTTASGSLTTGSTTMASTAADSLITGAVAFLSGSRAQIFPFATSLPAGEYWLGHMFSSTSSTTGTGYGGGTLWSTQSLVHNLEFVGRAYKRLGLSVSDASFGLPIFHGSNATVSSLPFAIINTSDMRNLLTNARMYWNYAQSSY